MFKRETHIFRNSRTFLAIMSAITALFGKNNAQLQAVDREITSLVDSISISDLSRDPNLKLLADDASNVEHDELKNQKLTQLAEKSSDLDTSLRLLNELWVVKNLIQEIKVGLNPLGEDDYKCDKDDLDSVLSNLSKLGKRVSQLDKSLVIRGVISHEVTLVKEQLDRQLLTTFSSFFPNPLEFHSVTDDSRYTISEFLGIPEKFTDLGLDPLFKSFIKTLQLLWESELDKLGSHRTTLELQRTEDSVRLVIYNNTAAFSALYFASLENFIRFVDIVDNQNLRNVFLSKMSHSLMVVISENIKTLQTLNKAATNELVNLVNMSRETGWSLSIGSSFNSNQNLHEKLGNLYLEWLEDKYIDDLRLFFKNDFKAASKLVSENTANSTDTGDDWGDQWNEDGWDEEIQDNWNWGDEEGPPPPKSPKKKRLNSANALSILVSDVPHKIQQIIDNFKAESKSDVINILAVAVQSLLLVYYPPIEHTFLCYNDMKFLSSLIGSPELSQFADTLWSQLKLKLSNQIVELVLGIDLNHDDYVAASSDLEQYELDEANWTQLSKINHWFKDLFEVELQATNKNIFHDYIMDVANLINSWIANSIIRMDEITEYQSAKITTIVEMMKNVTLPYVQQVGESMDKVESFHRLDNVVYLINNHLAEIKGRFYEGEFFDLQTKELTALIRAVFVQSEPRDDLVTEITEFRAMAEEN